MSLFEEYNELTAYAMSQYDQTSPEALCQRLTDLGGYLARTAELIAAAELEYNDKLNQELKKQLKSDVATTVAKKIAETECGQEKYTWTAFERLNAAIVHQIDAIRSQLSWLKMERSQT